MSKRYPTEREAADSMHKLTAMMVHNARRRDRFRAAFEDLTDSEKIGMICELIGIDEGEFLDWVTSRYKARDEDTATTEKQETVQ